MGKIEEKVRKQKRYGSIQRAVLGTVAVAGILSVALVAPKLFALARYIRIKPKRINDKVRAAIDALVRDKLLVREQRDGRWVLRLTPRGEEMVEESLLEQELEKRRKKRWDGKWRLVVFDIPEKRKHTRNILRFKMATLGFLKIQNSVWVFPYDCEDILVLIKTNLRLGKEVLYAVVDHIEGDTYMRKHFNLPLT